MAKKVVKNGWAEVFDGVSVKGTKDRFSINWYGATIHGCRIVNGENGKFIGWPSFKGKNGKYIKTAYVYDGPGATEDDVKMLEGVVKYFE